MEPQQIAIQLFHLFLTLGLEDFRIRNVFSASLFNMVYLLCRMNTACGFLQGQSVHAAVLSWQWGQQASLLLYYLKILSAVFWDEFLPHQNANAWESL